MRIRRLAPMALILLALLLCACGSTHHISHAHYSSIYINRHGEYFARTNIYGELEWWSYVVSDSSRNPLQTSGKFSGGGWGVSPVNTTTLVATPRAVLVDESGEPTTTTVNASSVPARAMIGAETISPEAKTQMTEAVTGGTAVSG